MSQRKGNQPNSGLDRREYRLESPQRSFHRLTFLDGRTDQIRVCLVRNFEHKRVAHSLTLTEDRRFGKGPLGQFGIKWAHENVSVGGTGHYYGRILLFG